MAEPRKPGSVKPRKPGLNLRQALAQKQAQENSSTGTKARKSRPKSGPQSATASSARIAGKGAKESSSLSRPPKAASPSGSKKPGARTMRMRAISEAQVDDALQAIFTDAADEAAPEEGRAAEAAPGKTGYYNAEAEAILARGRLSYERMGQLKLQAEYDACKSNKSRVKFREKHPHFIPAQTLPHDNRGRVSDPLTPPYTPPHDAQGRPTNPPPPISPQAQAELDERIALVNKMCKLHCHRCHRSANMHENFTGPLINAEPRCPRFIPEPGQADAYWALTGGKPAEAYAETKGRADYDWPLPRVLEMSEYAVPRRDEAVEKVLAFNQRAREKYPHLDWSIRSPAVYDGLRRLSAEIERYAANHRVDAAGRPPYGTDTELLGQIKEACLQLLDARKKANDNLIIDKTSVSM